jgi:hypothetical protein
MQAPTTYVFSMDRWLPATLPAKRLAQYIERLAALFGEQDSVHFVKIKKGSAQPTLAVAAVAADSVWNRLQAANDGSLPEAVAIRQDLNRMLIEDDCTGYLRVEGGPKVIVFQGRKTPISEEVAIHETGDLEGMVIRVGGRDASVPVSLDAGAGVYHKCTASRAVAKRLANHLFEGEVRVSGKGKWLRGTDGVWILQSFDISDFEPLDRASLSAFVSEMRLVEGSEWNTLPNPQSEFEKLRED